MELYTFVLDFRGGTYVSQVEAINERDALKKWTLQIDRSQVAGAVEEFNQLLKDENRDDPIPIPLNGLINTWCQNYLVGDDLATVNLILTKS